MTKANNPFVTPISFDPDVICQPHGRPHYVDYVLDDWKTLAIHHFFLELSKYKNTHEQNCTTSMEYSLGFLRLAILNHKMALARGDTE